MSSDKALSHRRRRRRAGRPEVAAAQDPLAGGRAGRRLEPGRAAGLDRRRSAATGPTTTTGGAARRCSIASPQFTTDDRRARHPLPPRALAARRRPAADHHPRLAGLDRRVPQGDRAADRSRPRTAAMPPTRSTWSARRCPASASRTSPRPPAGASIASPPPGPQLMDRLGYARYGAQGGDWGSAVTTALGAQDAAALRRHPHHARHVGAAQGRGRADARGGAGAQGHQVLRRLGLGLLQAAVDPAADPGLRPDRFAGRPGGVDPREVLGVDRLRRPPGEHPQPRRAARQRHALLGDRVGRLVGPALLGELRPGAAHRPQGRPCRPAWRCSRRRSCTPVRRWMEGNFTNIRHWNEMPKGGHFAAFEQPELFVDDVRAFFRTLR